jgi:hypothetical protein
MPARSLEPDQTAKLVERLANKCGKTVPSRLIFEFIKARTLNHTLPLATRSNPAQIKHCAKLGRNNGPMRP